MELTVFVALAVVPFAWSCSQAAPGSDTTAASSGTARENDPAAVFDSYLQAVHARDMESVMALISDDVARVNYPGCTPDMDNKACLATYVQQAVVDAAGEIVVQSVAVQGDTLLAKLELRSDLTRRAGVERALGTDRLRVLDNHIVEFAFIPDFADEQTATFFASLGVSPSGR